MKRISLILFTLMFLFALSSNVFAGFANAEAINWGVGYDSDVNDVYVGSVTSVTTHCSYTDGYNLYQADDEGEEGPVERSGYSYIENNSGLVNSRSTYGDSHVVLTGSQHGTQWYTLDTECWVDEEHEWADRNYRPTSHSQCHRTYAYISW